MTMVKAKKPVLIRCTTPKCPRKRRIDRDEFMPPGCTEVHSACPWHERNGDKEYEVLFFIDGVQWWEGMNGWEPVHKSQERS